MPTVSVCVPVYRGHGEPNVATLAASLAAAVSGGEGLEAELVVALNGISAEEAGVPAGATIADLGVNRGVAPGWNAAAHAARGDVLAFANDDVVLGEGSLALLVGALLDRDDAGVVGPVGTRWDLAGPHHLEWVDLDGRPDGDVEECEVLSGFLFAARREVFERAGGFDDAYAPCSYEELDFCTTVRVRLGLRCYAVAGVPVEHEYGVSVARPWTRIRYDGRSESLRSIHRRNRRHFQQKWAGAV